MADEHYEQRDVLLRQLGFSSYAEYLSSDLWRRIRKAFLGRNPRCCVCRKPARQVHHVKYTLGTLSGDDSKWLVSVCRDCHRASEIDSNGMKRSWIDSQKEMLRMLRESPAYRPKQKPKRNTLSKRARNRKRWAERRTCRSRRRHTARP